MKKVILMLTFLITNLSYAGGVGGGGGGTGPKPTGDNQMILEFTNEFGEFEELELNLQDIETILTQDEIILTNEDLRGFSQNQEVSPKVIEYRDGSFFNLEN